MMDDVHVKLNPGLPWQPPEIDPGTSRLVAQCFNHYATPGPQR